MERQDGLVSGSNTPLYVKLRTVSLRHGRWKARTQQTFQRAWGNLAPVHHNFVTAHKFRRRKVQKNDIVMDNTLSSSCYFEWKVLLTLETRFYTQKHFCSQEWLTQNDAWTSPWPSKRYANRPRFQVLIQQMRYRSTSFAQEKRFCGK